MNITDRKCLIAGGGKVALRKTKRLLKCKARVIVVSPQIKKEIKSILPEKNIIKDKYRSEYCKDSFLVFAATDKKKLNQKIAEDARKTGSLVNVVNDLNDCDFIVPALVNKGDLQIAISSGGKSPALSKKIRKEFEVKYDNDYKDKLKLLGELREIIKSEINDENKRKIIFNKMADLI
ncbi:MAG: precorrin-2 dehydrogenase/sirohydrochlorin ferrochelatase family protein [Bacillota bacterium]